MPAEADALGAVGVGGRDAATACSWKASSGAKQQRARRRERVRAAAATAVGAAQHEARGSRGSPRSEGNARAGEVDRPKGRRARRARRPAAATESARRGSRAAPVARPSRSRTASVRNTRSDRSRYARALVKHVERRRVPLEREAFERAKVVRTVETPGRADERLLHAAVAFEARAIGPSQSGWSEATRSRPSGSTPSARPPCASMRNPDACDADRSAHRAAGAVYFTCAGLASRMSVFVSRNGTSPSVPPSRPMPDCLKPPKAMLKSVRKELCPTVPERSSRAVA